MEYKTKGFGEISKESPLQKNLNKRNRSSNWNETEKNLLTRLIKGKIDLIENKDVTKTSNQLKKEAWQEILESFNKLNDTKRDLAQLINQWRNTKNNVKKRDFEYRRKCNATGGGPGPPSPPPEDAEIMKMIPKEFEITFDSDSDPMKMDSDNDSLQIKKEHVENNKADLNQPGSSSISLPTEIVYVQTPKSEEVHRKETTQVHYKKKLKRRITPAGTIEQREIFLLAKSAREKQIHFQEVEHKRRMDIMEAEHQMRVEIMKKELEYWINKTRIVN